MIELNVSTSPRATWPWAPNEETARLRLVACLVLGTDQSDAIAQGQPAPRGTPPRAVLVDDPADTGGLGDASQPWQQLLGKIATAPIVGTSG